MTNCIIHPKQYRWVPRRADYLEITADACAAELLAVFEFCVNGRLREAELQGSAADPDDIWLPLTIRQLQEALLWVHSRNVVRRGLQILEEKQLITRRRNPENPYDQTPQFKFRVSVVQEAIDALWKNPGSDLTPGSDLNGLETTTRSNLISDPLLKEINLKNSRVCVPGKDQEFGENDTEQDHQVIPKATTQASEGEPEQTEQKGLQQPPPLTGKDQASPVCRFSKVAISEEGFRALWNRYPGVAYSDGRQRGSQRRAREAYFKLGWDDARVLKVLDDAIEQRQRRKSKGEWVPTNWPHLENWLLDLPQIEEELSQTQLNLPYTAAAEATAVAPPEDHRYPACPEYGTLGSAIATPRTTQHPPAFLSWYAQAQDRGIVTDDSPEVLRMAYGDRLMVRIKTAHGWEPWTWEDARAAWPNPGGPSAEPEPEGDREEDPPITQREQLETLKYLMRQFGDGNDPHQVQAALEGIQRLLEERDAVLGATVLAWARSRSHLIEVEVEDGLPVAIEEAF